MLMLADKLGNFRESFSHRGESVGLKTFKKEKEQKVSGHWYITFEFHSLLVWKNRGNSLKLWGKVILIRENFTRTNFRFSLFVYFRCPPNRFWKWGGKLFLGNHLIVWFLGMLNISLYLAYLSTVIVRNLDDKSYSKNTVW